MVSNHGVDLVDVQEAAAIAGRTAETIRRWVWSGRLTAERDGNRLVMARADVMRLVGVSEPAPAALTLAEWAERARRAQSAGEGSTAHNLVLEDREAREVADGGR